MRLLLIASAGAVGALCRYGIALAVGPVGFLWVTLGINVVGSFLLGVLVAVLPAPDNTIRAVVGTGLLGAFTTLSPFSVETVTLVRDGRPGAAAGYVVASLLLGVAAAGVGLLLGDHLGGR